MNTGQVIGGALRLLRRGRLVAIGMAVAVMGLAYALLDAVLRTNNSEYLGDIANSLTTRLPDNFGPLALLLVVAMMAGGLLAEAGLIQGAGSKPAAALLRGNEGPQLRGRRSPGVLARLPQLLLVGLLIWWRLMLVLLLLLSPALFWLFVSMSQQTSWVLLVLGSVCVTSIVFLAGWFWLWPQQRLANCALLLENLPPRDAVRTARELFTSNLGSTLGFWVVILLLNFGLALASLLLAGLAAGLVAAIWSALNGVEENVALLIVGVVALLSGLVLLIWDGAISAFNLNTWVLAYLDLRTGASGQLTPHPISGTTQMLGRQRELGWEGYE